MIDFLRQRAFVDFLKESTFAVNDVIMRAWGIMKKHYLSIATLCFLMFITAIVSTILSIILSEVDLFIRIFLLIIFVLLFFTLNLTLFRYIFHLMDNEDKDIMIIEAIPSKNQIVIFLLCSILIAFILIIVGLIVFFIPFLVYYLLLKIGILVADQQKFEAVSTVFLGAGIVASSIAFVRLSFFPFFIIDRKNYRLKFIESTYSVTSSSLLGKFFKLFVDLFKNSFLAFKLSLALTRGNFTKLLMLLVSLAATLYLYAYLRQNDVIIPGKLYIILLLLAFICFIIVPLSVVALTVAYRKMMDEYIGDEHPDILHNIV
jgi:hypothetical protein